MQRLIFAPSDAQHTERRLTAAFTGIRWGELIALRRTDIDLDTRLIRVSRAFAELGGGRLVVVPPKSEASGRGVTMSWWVS
ncbi:hypothetical protein ACWEOO_33570 [Kribbella sp. NPDC004138]